MFCPKCGSTLPDGASFCNKCGNQIAAAPVSSSKRTASKVTISDSGSGDGMRLAAILVTIGIFITALLPWFESTAYLMHFGNFGNAIGQFGSALSGQSYNSVGFAGSYSVFGFLSLADAFRRLLYANGSMLSGTVTFFFIVWLISLVFIIVGFVMRLMHMRRMTLFTIVGASLMTFTSFAWSIVNLVLVRDGYTEGIAIFPFICGILSIALIVFAVMARKKKNA